MQQMVGFQLDNGITEKPPTFNWR